MVAHLVSLRLKLFKAAVTRSAARMVGVIIGMIVSFSLAFGIAAGLAATRGRSASLHRNVPILMLSVAALLWIALSVISVGVDDSLEPGRFALFPLRARQLMPGLLIGSLIAEEGVLWLFILGGLIWAWTTSIVTAIAAGVAITVGLLALMLFTRLLAAAMNAVIHSRSFRDVSFIIIVLGMSLSGLMMQFVAGMFSAQTSEARNSMLGTPVAILSWTPVGWAPAIPACIDAGDWLGAGIRFALLLGTTALLWKGWEHFLNIALTSPLEAKSTSEKVKEASWVDRVFRANARGAIAARSLRYWRRDPRHLVALASVVMMPVLFLGPLFFGTAASDADRMGLLTWAPLCSAWVGGPMLGSELSYDGSALAAHVLAGVKGSDDRWGRLYAIAVIIIPLQIVMFLGLAAINGRWVMVPAVVGASIALLLCGMGASSWISTIWNVPSPPPGANPFAKGSGGGVATWLNFFGTMLLTFIPSAPSLILAVMASAKGELLYGCLSLALALIIGLPLLALGIWLGGKRLDGHWPEIVKQVTYEG